jgi:hypothetical protein
MLAKALPERAREDTISTIFGKAVGVGIQALVSGKSLDASLFAAMLAWEWPLDYSDIKGERAKKNAWFACQAIVAFHTLHLPDIGSDWEIFTLPNGQPSTEAAFRIAMPTGTYERGYIDVILQHKVTKQLAVIELKTTGLAMDASGGSIMYGNSGQGTSYTVVTDYLARQLGLDSNMQVFYITLYTKSQEWQLYPFTKPQAARLNWLRGLKQEHLNINSCRSNGVWPMRGSSCSAWGRACFAFGICDLAENLEKVPDMPDSMEHRDNGFAIDVTYEELLGMYQE